MSDISNFSDSDAVDLLKELDNLDDLDSKLLGDKSRKPSLPSQFTNEEAKVKHELPSTTKEEVDDFDDDDDPLADLLSDEAKEQTKNLIKRSIALAVPAELKPDVPSKPPLVKQDSIDSPQKSDPDLKKSSPVFKQSSEKSPARQPTKKEDIDFGDDDLLDNLVIDEKDQKSEMERRTDRPGRTAAVKADVDFGDDDLLDDLGFGGGATRQKGRDAEKAVGRRAVSFMDDLLGSGGDKKSSADTKEFSLGERYKSPPTQGEPEAGYSPSAGVRTDVPRRRRTADDAPSLSPALKKQQALESLFEDPPPIAPPMKVESPEKRPTTGRRPASSPGTDWLGEMVETSPKKKQQSDWLGGTDKAKSMDWLGGSAGKPEIPEKGAKTGAQEKELDWLQMKKNLKSTEDVTPEPAKSASKQPTRDAEDNANSISLQAAVVSPKLVTSSVINNQAALNRERNELVANIQGLAVSVQVEKDQFLKTIENLNERHKEELKSTEMFYKNQLKIAEDLHKDTENRYRSELGFRIGDLQESVTRLEKEKAELLLLQQEKAEKMERERKQEVDRLKDLHSQGLLSLRREHQDSLSRLQRLKEQELHAMASAEEHNRSVQQVMCELEAKTAQLSSLQERLEGQHQEALEGRRAALEAKEQQVKALEVRHQRAHEESEEERSRLQQLILRLEKRMVDQTRELEEERWKVLQERGRLESRSQALEEKQLEVEHQMARDRNRLQQAKDMCLQEQRGIWQQVANERQALSDREAILRRKEEDIQGLQSKRIQEEIRLESEQRHLQQERVHLEGARARVREEESSLVREKEAMRLLRERLKEEMDAANNNTALHNRRERELDEKARLLGESREEGQLAVATARQLESSIQKQQHKVAQQIQTLHEKEHNVMQERMAMLDESQRLENTRNSLICANCRLAYIRPLGVTNPSSILDGQFNSGQPGSLPSYAPIQPSFAPMLVKEVSEQPSLVIWKLLADKDKAFLEEEQRFLDSLNLP